MANLLETIVRQLLSTSAPKKTVKATARTVPKTAYTSTPSQTVTVGESVKIKPIDTPSANAWVKNSTISDVANTTFDRTIKRERTHREVGREDLLLNQIDEFREKAQQLQDLLLSKESKVAELQNIVDEREGKAKELEYILSERQRKADGITEEMTKQIDTLIGKVSAKMDEIGTSINETVGKELSDNRELNEKQITELKELLASITPQLETIKTELSDKVHTENVKCYRNISDLFKSMEDKLDKVNDVEQKVNSVQKCTIAIIILAVINMLGLTALALYELGVFQLLLG
ncbi:MAG: hypothetical protein IJ419_05305 [Agathobacter sp.]|nr:hypothetical protein [Agathobacter sp.]